MSNVRTRWQNRDTMRAKCEYKFIRLGEGWFSARKGATDEYQEVVHQHAREGWRLVQVFAPGIGAYGAAKYYDIIFERELDE